MADELFVSPSQHFANGKAHDIDGILSSSNITLITNVALYNNFSSNVYIWISFALGSSCFWENSAFSDAATFSTRSWGFDFILDLLLL